MFRHTISRFFLLNMVLLLIGLALFLFASPSLTTQSRHQGGYGGAYQLGGQPSPVPTPRLTPGVTPTPTSPFTTTPDGHHLYGAKGPGGTCQSQIFGSVRAILQYEFALDLTVVDPNQDETLQPMNAAYINDTTDYLCEIGRAHV